jgi:succinoglycan biosynthesis protein ExoA
MKISVIVPCRNEKAYISEFLDSLGQQDLDLGCELEVLVADGRSDDGTREILRQYAACNVRVRLIDNPGRITPTGLNAAIAAATGDVIVRMDVHTTYARDYIRECVQALVESGADNVGGPWVAEGQGRIGRAIAAAFQSPLCGGKAHNPEYEGEVDTVYLGCWPRAVFERIGLFDPELVRNQDDEFNFRLRRMGGRVWQTPRVKSCYSSRGSLAALFRQYVQYGYWKVAVIRKHKALAAWRHLGPAMLVSSVAAAMVGLVIAAVLGASVAAAVIAGLLALEAIAYVTVCVGTSVRYAGTLDWSSRIIMPVVVGVYHCGYGVGFLAGAIQCMDPRSRKAAPARMFSELTR